MPSGGVVSALRSCAHVVNVTIAPAAGAAAPPPEPWWWAPTLAAALTVLGAWVAISFDRRKAINQELIKKRIELYNEIVPLANDLFVYFMRVGGFRSMTPATLLNHRHVMDRAMKINGPLFSKSVTDAYDRFAKSSFETFRGVGQSARLRANRDKLKLQFGNDWRPAWDDSFVEPAQAVASEVITSGYDRLVRAFAREIGVPGGLKLWPWRK